MNNSPVADHSWSAHARRGSCVALLWVGLLLGGAAPLLHAQPAGLPTDLAFVPADAVGVVVCRVADLWNGEVGQSLRKHAGKALDPFLAEMEKGTGFGPGDIERGILAFSMPQGISRPPEMLFLITTTRPYAKDKLKALVPELREQQHKGKSYYVSGKPSPGPNLGVAFLSDRLVAVAEPPALMQLLERGTGTGPRGQLAAALGQLEKGKHHFYSVSSLAPILKELPRDLPPEAEPFKALLKARFATQAISLGKDIRAQVALTFADADEAAAGAKALNAALDMLRPMLAQALPEIERAIAKEVPEFVQVFKKIQATLENLKAQHSGSDVKLAIHIDVNVVELVATTLLPAVQKVRAAANRMTSTNNLKQIALAMHNYHDTYRHLPMQAIHSKDGKPLLSWRVAVLPFLEEDDLYRQFKLDEPWDSTHNKKLLTQMPKTYALPGVTTKEPYTTHYQVFTGKGTLFDGPNKTSFTRVTDGLSNTLLVVEAAEAVPWTKPDDLPYDPKKPLPKLGSFFTAGANAAFGDGAVRALRPTLAEEVLRALITASGGEVINQAELDK